MEEKVETQESPPLSSLFDCNLALVLLFNYDHDRADLKGQDDEGSRREDDKGSRFAYNILKKLILTRDLN
jgi:hypothetical protein